MSEPVVDIYEQDLERRAANHEPLSPLTFIERTAAIYPHKLAMVHGEIRRDWAETYRRCRRLASALERRGIKPGDTVSIIAPNIPAHFEAHFGVPMAGAVLNSINTRLDAPAIAFILEHAEAKAVLVDCECAEVVGRALARLEREILVVDIADASFEGAQAPIGELDYESFLAEGDPTYSWRVPDDEWRAITLNYTSGTTGNPKGVVYHHRGAYLGAINNVLSWGLPNHAVYLWTLPMFHCNGWCFPWTMAAMAGVNVCLRHVRARPIVETIAREGVTHLCGAPIVLKMINEVPAEAKAEITQSVRVMTAGAPPPSSVIAGMEAMGFEVTHVYGLTETYGPCVACAWNDAWDGLALEERARLKSRQGVRMPMQAAIMVADPATLQPIRQDGETLGEIMIRGNLVMKGYLKNPETTRRAFDQGWFHSGDLAVWHPDGYVEIKDRSKDIIISGGENISSIEVEETLSAHPLIQDVAVVAKRDEKWGEVPCAFITLMPGAELTEQAVIDYCRAHMAHFKAPKQVVFTTLPRTSTGKLQKYILRQWANEEGAGASTPV
ncbi:acyl-CoA synthetase [Marichromatium bheemlicum]|uniref:Acyl-CoA synthetase n=1 Tax=Marichromatium bheemlicum TaxID=365339 RepID=A0ABX1I6X3_9GAMM|nr:acyl-CoA synthetase [Marichromatium bheemlicum]NKN32501.1 acyl-CoA synthetase [Marichromatium bheemlicum]